MSYLDFVLEMLDANRQKTLSALERADKLGALAWRPGDGRAHCGWQFMHIAATEEGFACKRFHDRDLVTPDLVHPYKHGSTPVDESPSADEIRDYFAASRQTLVSAIRELDESKLDEQPATMADRGWSYREALQLVSWHEGHHQGQAHITLNLFENQ